MHFINGLMLLEKKIMNFKNQRSRLQRDSINIYRGRGECFKLVIHPGFFFCNDTAFIIRMNNQIEHSIVYISIFLGQINKIDRKEWVKVTNLLVKYICTLGKKNYSQVVLYLNLSPTSSWSFQLSVIFLRLLRISTDG